MTSVAQAAASGPAVGAVVDITWGSSRTDIDRTVQAMRAGGVTWVRASINWAELEPGSSGMLDHTRLAARDYAISQARAAGLQVLMPIADGVPYWASGDPAKYRDATGEHWNRMWRPTRASDYGAFVGAMVRHYRPMGVHTYEIWNEPNTSRFWPSGPNAAQYAELLAAAYPAVKAADPKGMVLTGGLSKNDYPYLGQLYAAGGRRFFDAVAVHPYTGSVDPVSCWRQAGTTQQAVDAFCSIEEVRHAMVANGDSAKAIWLTEFGWSTSTGPYGVSEASQATFLKAALDQLGRYPYVHAAFWYSGRDTAANPGVYDDNLGLLRFDFTPKPAYAALKAWAASASPSVKPAPPFSAARGSGSLRSGAGTARHAPARSRPSRDVPG